MGALTLLLIVDICNREHVSNEPQDRPRITQAYKESYPRIIAPAAIDEDDECYAYRKPAWMKI